MKEVGLTRPGYRTLGRVSDEGAAPASEASAVPFQAVLPTPPRTKDAPVPARRAPALQATAGSSARVGGPRAEHPSESSTPRVAGAKTTVRSRMRWSQWGQAQESTSNALPRSQAHGTHREVAAGYLASRSEVPGIDTVEYQHMEMQVEVVQTGLAPSRSAGPR